MDQPPPIAQPARTRGRPRSFDVDETLDLLLPVFREHGCDGASIDVLKRATGLTAGSLYKAFKDKNHIFAAAFDRYLVRRRTELNDRLEGASSGRARIAETLRFYLDSSSGVEGRLGCLVLGSLVEASTLEPMLRAVLDEAVLDLRGSLAAMIEDGQRDGSISDTVGVGPCADLILSLLQGLRAVGKVRDTADHEAFVALALKILD